MVSEPATGPMATHPSVTLLELLGLERENQSPDPALHWWVRVDVDTVLPPYQR